ncbi:hypothetical protein SCHPADRAFT_751638 [Schizopora paradoxa]|uniref:Uncharacterized protein n=1 Tax=Schizopora paradoxa TaxID=27342 RepID=A0A0H2QZV9_9AGAM|nr:hypothetical protein SCHPADRAFT_751638 [Schizopora paradoxa]
MCPYIMLGCRRGGGITSKVEAWGGWGSGTKNERRAFERSGSTSQRAQKDQPAVSQRRCTRMLTDMLGERDTARTAWIKDAHHDTARALSTHTCGDDLKSVPSIKTSPQQRRANLPHTNLALLESYPSQKIQHEGFEIQSGPLLFDDSCLDESTPLACLPATWAAIRCCIEGTYGEWKRGEGCLR